MNCIINRAQNGPPSPPKRSPLAAVWNGMERMASRLVGLEKLKTAERLEALEKDRAERDDLVAQLRGIVDRARADRSDRALETVIAGLDATIQSLNASRRGIEPHAGSGGR